MATGIKPLEITVSNDYLGSYTSEMTYYLDVLEGINVTMIDSPAYWRTAETVTFNLLAQSGKCVTWVTFEHNSTSSQIQFYIFDFSVLVFCNNFFNDYYLDVLERM